MRVGRNRPKNTSLLAQLVLGDHVELLEMGVVYVSASQESLEAHREGKVPQYPTGLPGGIPGAYTVMPHGPTPPYHQKPGSSRRLITSRWMAMLEDEALPQLLGPECDARKLKSVEKVWEHIPDMLEARAFVPRYVRELLAKRRAEVSSLAVSSVIESAYIDGYADALDAKVVAGLVYLGSPFDLAGAPAFSFRETLIVFDALGLMPLLDDANVHELLRFKTSSEWHELWPRLEAGEPLDAEQYELAEQAAIVAAGRHHFPSVGHMDCHVGIVTALPEEFAAMKALLDGPHETRKVPNDPNSYCVGAIPALRDGRTIGAHKVVLTQLRKPGTDSAAAAAANLIRSFPSVRLILMVGVACGVPHPSDPSKHVRLGDIVVSDKQGIVNFASGSVTDARFEHRHSLPPPSSALIDAANALDAGALVGDRPWETYLNTLAANAAFVRPAAQTDILYDSEAHRLKHPRDSLRTGGQPRVFRGVIGSSDILLRSATFRDELASQHALRAIEMEGSGIASAAWDHSQPYGVVRAACDYGDGAKADTWHNYAAAAAAAYARSLVERIAPEDLRAIRARGVG